MISGMNKLCYDGSLSSFSWSGYTIEYMMNNDNFIEWQTTFLYHYLVLPLPSYLFRRYYGISFFLSSLILAIKSYDMIILSRFGITISDIFRYNINILLYHNFLFLLSILLPNENASCAPSHLATELLHRMIPKTVYSSNSIHACTTRCATSDALPSCSFVSIQAICSFDNSICFEVPS